jgi:ribosomal protein L11 methyltransferase
VNRAGTDAKAHLNSNEWICFEVVVSPPEVDGYVELFWEMGTVGLEEVREGDQIRIKAFFPGAADDGDLTLRFKDMSRAAGRAPESRVYRAFSNPDDWVENYKKNFHGFAVGERFYIHPSWEKGDERRPINLVIDPGHAFGTGTHESTRLCLLMLEDAVQVANSFLDVGTGSGILAITAKKLNPRLQIIAFDVDPQAIEMALENVAKNLSEPLPLFAGPPQAIKRPFDLVVANLAYGVFQDAAAEVARLAARELIVSGITVDQAPFVQKLFEQTGPPSSRLDLAEQREDNGWACLRFKRRNRIF